LSGLVLEELGELLLLLLLEFGDVLLEECGELLLDEPLLP